MSILMDFEIWFFSSFTKVILSLSLFKYLFEIDSGLVLIDACVCLTTLAHMHARVHTHTHTHVHMRVRTFANAHTQLPGLITYIEDGWLLFGLFDYGFWWQMTAHIQSSDQRRFGENADVLLAQCVWNVGRFAPTDVVWPCVTLWSEKIQGQSVRQQNN